MSNQTLVANSVFAVFTILYIGFFCYLMIIFDRMLREQALQLQVVCPSIKVYGITFFTVTIQICCVAVVVRDSFIKLPLEIWARAYGGDHD